MDPELCVRIKDFNPSLDLQITAERYLASILKFPWKLFNMLQINTDPDPAQ
jgi:hypothetical protein